MLGCKGLTSTLIISFLALFSSPGTWAETTDTLADWDQLKQIRQGRRSILKPVHIQPAKPVARVQNDRLLAIIPPASLFCVRVNHFDYTLHSIDQFLLGLSPLPKGLSMMARMKFAQALGSPDLKGVNMNGSFAVFAAPLPGPSTPPGPSANVFIGGLIPITDYQQFVAGNPNVGQPDANGVSKITPSAPGPATPPPKEAARGKSKKALPMLVTQVGNYALIARDQDYGKLLAMSKSTSTGLAGVLEAAEIQRATTEPIWAYGNVQQASKNFGPRLSAQLDQIKAAMQKTKPAAPGPMVKPENVINMYSSLLQTLMKETQSVSLTISPNPNACIASVGISAVPGTDMADMFASAGSANQENNLLGYLQNGAFMNLACKMDTPLWKMLNLKCIDWLRTFAGETVSDQDINQWKALAAEMADSLGGPMACSFAVDPQNKPPFALRYIIELRDVVKFNQVMEESMRMINTGALANFYKQMGMKTSFTIQRGIDRYKGISIDSATFLFQSTAPDSPQGRIIQQIYGAGLKYRWATVDKLWLCVTGGDVDTRIQELIDEVQAAAPRPPADEIKAALALLPQANKADFMGTFNVMRLFGMAAAMMPAPLPKMDIPTKNNIVFAGRSSQGKLTFDLALPKDHITEIITAVQTMQQQAALSKAGMQGKRVLCLSNLKRIALACIIYADDHQGKLPADLQQLIPYLGGTVKAQKILDSPFKPEGFDGPSYIYIAGQTTAMDPGNILVYDNPAFCTDGICVAFLDGHSEWMKPASFLRALEATYKPLGRQMPVIKFKDPTKGASPEMQPIMPPRLPGEGPRLAETQITPVITSETRTGIVKATVAGVRLVRYSDFDSGIMPLGKSKGYTLSIIAPLPEPAIKVAGGVLERAATDTGKNLLPEHEWDRKIKFPRLAKDHKTVVFEVDLLLPDEGAIGLPEFSGTLQYLTAGTPRELDLGTMDFKVGAKGSALGAVIRSIQTDPWRNNATVMSLKLNLPPEELSSAQFYAPDGTKLDVKQTGFSCIGASTTFDFSIQGQLPSKGRMVLKLFDQLKKNVIPFKITNVSLTGAPL